MPHRKAHRNRRSVMRKLNLAEGTLVLLGMILLLSAAIIKLKDINLLYPLLTSCVSTLVVANTCFLLAFVVSIFGGEE